MVEKFNSDFRIKRWHIIAIGAFILSIIVFIISILFLFFISSIIESNIQQTSSLSDDSLLLEKWSHPKYTIKTNMYTFSVRNPDAVLNNTKPIVHKTGPYVFDQKQKRKIHSISNGTIKFETIQSYFFNEADSCPVCFLHNRVWIPNLIYQKFVETASKPSMRAATAALFVQKPFLEVDVAELLFDGYTDPFLDQVCAIPIVNFICESVLNLPERIGFFYQKNGTSSGVFEINNGEINQGQDLGKIITWKGESKIPEAWWSNEQARKINGCDGSVFEPFLKKTQNITVFVPELCRTLKLRYERDLVVSGVPAYRYVVSKENFDFTLDENKGYCNPKSGKVYFDEQKEECLPNGLLDISRCQQGDAPIVISMPNFLYAPDYVQKSIEGLEEPVEDEDQIQLDLEPRLGAVLQARRRFQINIAMWKGVNISLPGSDLNRLKSSIVPVLLIDETVRIDSESLELIKEKLIYTEKLVYVAAFSAAIFSVLAAIIVILYALHRKGTKNGDQIFPKNFVSPKSSGGGDSTRNIGKVADRTEP